MLNDESGECSDRVRTASVSVSDTRREGRGVVLRLVACVRGEAFGEFVGVGASKSRVWLLARGLEVGLATGPLNDIARFGTAVDAKSGVEAVYPFR